MKDSAEHGARLKRLCARIRREMGAQAVSAGHDPTTELVLACLSAGTTEAKARTTLNRLRSNFVDFNELRVSRPDEIVEILGKNFPQGTDTAEAILAALRELFDLRDTLDMTDLIEGGKREAKVFLEGLENLTPYMIACVLLHSLDAHAFPVNAQMMDMLRGGDVITAKADAGNVQGFLERQLSATTIRKTYILLRKYADSYRGVAKTSKKTGKKAAKKTKTTSTKKTAKKAAKKTTKKTTKTTTKKTAKKATKTTTKNTNTES